MNTVYGLICYNFACQGILYKTPEYLVEQFDLVTKGLDAFTYLTAEEQESVVEYCRTWGLKVPDSWIKTPSLNFSARSNES